MHVSSFKLDAIRVSLDPNSNHAAYVSFIKSNAREVVNLISNDPIDFMKMIGCR